MGAALEAKRRKLVRDVWALERQFPPSEYGPFSASALYISAEVRAELEKEDEIQRQAELDRRENCRDNKQSGRCRLVRVHSGTHRALRCMRACTEKDRRVQNSGSKGAGTRRAHNDSFKLGIARDFLYLTQGKTPFRNHRTCSPDCRFAEIHVEQLRTWTKGVTLMCGCE